MAANFEMDAIAVRRLGKLQSKVQRRRAWLESILQEKAVIAPSLSQWNPQSEYGGGIFLDDLDMMLIALPNQSNKEAASKTQLGGTAETIASTALMQSIAQASLTMANIVVYGWALELHNGNLVPIHDMPCVPIPSSQYKTPRGAARLVCNSLAPLTVRGTIPQYVAIYTPSVKRLSSYKVRPKFCNSHNLANESNLSSASKKICHISLADASCTSLAHSTLLPAPSKYE